MLKVFLNWLKSLFAHKRSSQTAANKVSAEALTFSLVLSNDLYTRLKKHETLVIERKCSKNVNLIAKAFADFKSIKLKCCKGAITSKDYMLADLTYLKKESGVIKLTVKLVK